MDRPTNLCSGKIPTHFPSSPTINKLQINVHVIHAPIGQEPKGLQQVRHLGHVPIHLLHQHRPRPLLPLLVLLFKVLLVKRSLSDSPFALFFILLFFFSTLLTAWPVLDQSRRHHIIARQPQQLTRPHHSYGRIKRLSNQQRFLLPELTQEQGMLVWW